MDGDDTRKLLRRIDDYVADLYAPPDDALTAALRESVIPKNSENP